MITVLMTLKDGRQGYRYARYLDLDENRQVRGFVIEGFEGIEPDEFFNSNKDIASLLFVTDDNRYTVVPT